MERTPEKLLILTEPESLEFFEIIFADNSSRLSDFLAKIQTPHAVIKIDKYKLPNLLRGRIPLIFVSAFFKAINCFEMLQSNNADIEYQSLGYSLLHYIMASGSVDLMRLVDEPDYSYFDLDRYKVPPIYYASAFGHLHIIQYFWHKGYSPTPLLLNAACLYGHIDIIRFLLENNIAPLQSALLTATMGGHNEAIDLLFETKADFDLSEPLRIATRNGNFSTVIKLVEKGAKFTRNHAKVSPVVDAAIYGHVDILRFYLANGASPDLCHSSGSSLLHYVCTYCHERCVKLLIDYGATKNSSILEAACRSKSDFIIKAVYQQDLTFFTSRSFLYLVQDAPIPSIQFAITVGKFYSEPANPTLMEALSNRPDFLECGRVLLNVIKFGDSEDLRPVVNKSDLLKLFLDHNPRLQSVFNLVDDANNSNSIHHLLDYFNAHTIDHEEIINTASIILKHPNDIEILKELLPYFFQHGNRFVSCQVLRSVLRIKSLPLLDDLHNYLKYDIFDETGENFVVTPFLKSREYVPFFEVMCRNGFDSRLTLKDGSTALVPMKLDADVLDVLLRYGLDANYKDLLVVATKQREYGIAAVLIKHGANVNIRDHLGETPLFAAVRNDNSQQYVHLLLANGADPNVLSNQNKTALQVAVKGGNWAAVSELLKTGVDGSVLPSNYARVLSVKIEAKSDLIGYQRSQFLRDLIPKGIIRKKKK